MMVLKNEKNEMAEINQSRLRARGCQSIPFLPKQSVKSAYPAVNRNRRPQAQWRSVFVLSLGGWCFQASLFSYLEVLG